MRNSQPLLFFNYPFNIIPNFAGNIPDGSFWVIPE